MPASFSRPGWQGGWCHPRRGKRRAPQTLSQFVVRSQSTLSRHHAGSCTATSLLLRQVNDSLPNAPSRQTRGLRGMFQTHCRVWDREKGLWARAQTKVFLSCLKHHYTHAVLVIALQSSRVAPILVLDHSCSSPTPLQFTVPYKLSRQVYINR